MPASSLSISNITMLPGKAPPLSQIRPNTRPVLAAPPSATGGARMGPATPLLQHQQPRSAATSISPGLRGSAPPSQHPATTHMVQSTAASSIPAVAFPVTLRAPVSPAAAAPNNGGGGNNSGGSAVRLQIPVSQQQLWGGLVTTGLGGVGTVRAPGAILTSGLGGGGRPPPAAANLLPVGSRAVTMAALNFRPQPVNARPPMSGGGAAAVKTATPSHLGAGGISAQLGAASQAALKPPSVSGSGGVTRLTAVTSSTAVAAGTGKLISPITAAPMVSLTPATHIQVPLSVNCAAMRLDTYLQHVYCSARYRSTKFLRVSTGTVPSAYY